MKDREAWCAVVHGVEKNWTLNNVVCISHKRQKKYQSSALCGNQGTHLYKSIFYGIVQLIYSSFILVLPSFTEIYRRLLSSCCPTGKLNR